MGHAYDDEFFQWVDMTAVRSARILLPAVIELTHPRSVIDVGCGRGTWLSVWSELGVADFQGLDGAYVDRTRLAIAAERFTPADLTQLWPVSRRFDIAQSLEVAEHLPEAAARPMIAQLCALADVVLFSAAQPGQGGEMHVNEQPLAYWANLFAMHGYAAFDCLRPRLSAEADVDPWYRYNTLVYANAAGIARLAPEALATRVEDINALAAGGDLAWRLRRAVLAPLPVPVVTMLSRLRYLAATRMAGHGARKARAA